MIIFKDLKWKSTFIENWRPILVVIFFPHFSFWMMSQWPREKYSVNTIFIQSTSFSKWFVCEKQEKDKTEGFWPIFSYKDEHFPGHMISSFWYSVEGSNFEGNELLLCSCIPPPFSRLLFTLFASILSLLAFNMVKRKIRVETRSGINTYFSCKWTLFYLLSSCGINSNQIISSSSH